MHVGRATPYIIRPLTPGVLYSPHTISQYTQKHLYLSPIPIQNNCPNPIFTIMHSSPINMLMDAIVFCFVRSWQLLFTFFCELALGLTLKATEKTPIVDPERAVAYGW